MFIHKRNPLDPVGGTETPESVALNRRQSLRLSGLGIGAGLVGTSGYLGWKEWRGSDQEVSSTNAESADWESRLVRFYPAPREERFTYGRNETDRAVAARYTNFYEFSSYKSTWRFVD